MSNCFNGDPAFSKEAAAKLTSTINLFFAEKNIDLYIIDTELLCLLCTIMYRYFSFLSANIKILRARKSWSQEQLAKELGATRAKIAFIETNKTLNPLLADLVSLSDVFGVSLDILLKVDLTKFSETELLKLDKEGYTYASGAELRILATTVDKENNEGIELIPEKAKAGWKRRLN